MLFRSQMLPTFALVSTSPLCSNSASLVLFGYVLQPPTSPLCDIPGVILGYRPPSLCWNVVVSLSLLFSHVTLYRPLGITISRHDLACSLIIRSPNHLRVRLDPFLMPLGTFQNRHGHHALFSVRLHLWCHVTQNCAPPASRLLTRTNPAPYQYELELP